MKKKDVCWCNSRFHLPGEKRVHLAAQQKARADMKLPSFVGILDSGDKNLARNAKMIVRGEGMEEVATVDLNYQEICAILESGTVEHGSPLYVKLRTARDAFWRDPKVYGKGFGLKVRGIDV
jgi:hypothetical protein